MSQLSDSCNHLCTGVFAEWRISWKCKARHNIVSKTRKLERYTVIRSALIKKILIKLWWRERSSNDKILQEKTWYPDKDHSKDDTTNQSITHHTTIFLMSWSRSRSILIWLFLAFINNGVLQINLFCLQNKA